MEKQAKKLMKSAKSNWSKAKRTYICRSLKDLIKAYRACTTRSEERALVKKEAAHIRDLFREGDKAFRRQNISKLLFFHMNGYPTDFGMTECIKLCASSKYNDKRVAYLGLMILVDETADVLMLMTHCLQQDLHSEDLQIVSLALNVLGDISSVEMVRDLLPEIERHLLSTNPYIRKKAALASVRAVRKLTPEDTTNILRQAPVVFDIRSSAVHISGAALITALCQQNRANLQVLQPTVGPILLNIIRDLLLSKKTHNSDPVVGSVRNPFLQVKLLSALRVLLEFNASGDILEHASDVLAQVAANTDSSKIAGCAVLYECVRTIMSLNVDRSLQTLSANILGKFLSHDEPSVRYIALQELTRVVDMDGPRMLVNIDGYKVKILAALREEDPTVRKRAVELVYRIADGANVGEIVQELLIYIEKSTSLEAKQDACCKIFSLLDRFGPSDEWKVETFVKTLSCADMGMPEELITSFLALVSSNPNIHGHAVLKLYKEALEFKTVGSGESKSSDPFSFEQLDTGESVVEIRQTTPEYIPRKPRLERVALYILGEHGETAPHVGLEVTQVMDAFQRLLEESEVTDEPWMNTFEEAYREENKVLGEVALTGLVKFAQRAINGYPGALSLSEPMLAITGGQDTNLDPLSGILAIAPAPAPVTEAQDGFGTDLLSSMGLGDDKPKRIENGVSHALVPSFNSLTVNEDLMSSQLEMSAPSGNPVVDRVRRILLARARDSELETQQRACEYLMLLNESLLPLLATTMSPMPPLNFQKVQERARQRRELRSSRPVAEASGSGGDGSLLDLLGESTTGTGNKPLGLPAIGEDLLALPAPAPSTMGGGLNLEDLLGGGPSAMTGGGPSSAGVGTTAGFDIAALSSMPTEMEDTLDNSVGHVAGASAHNNGCLLTTTIYESEAVSIVAEFFRDDSTEQESTRAELLFTNKSENLMKKFIFLLAVPKYITLQMQPASSTEIESGGQATQTVNLINSLHGQRPIQLRYRVEYVDETSGDVLQQQGVAMGLEAL